MAQAALDIDMKTLDASLKDWHIWFDNEQMRMAWAMYTLEDAWMPSA